MAPYFLVIIMLWKRPSGNTIELKDTPTMEKYALSQGWTNKVKDDGDSGTSDKGDTPVNPGKRRRKSA